MMMMYLLGIRSPTAPVSPGTWKAFSRPKVTYDGITFFAGKDPLFTHQYCTRGSISVIRKRLYELFENSILATKAHKQYCLPLEAKFGHCCEDLWGISASDTPRGYTAPPLLGPVDGSIVPCAQEDQSPSCTPIAYRCYERSAAGILKEAGTVWLRRCV